MQQDRRIPATQYSLFVPARCNWNAALALIGSVIGWRIAFPFSFAFKVAIPASLQLISAVYKP